MGLLGQLERRGTADFKAPQCPGARHTKSPQALGRGRRGSSQHQEGSRTERTMAKGCDSWTARGRFKDTMP